MAVAAGVLRQIALMVCHGRPERRQLGRLDGHRLAYLARELGQVAFHQERAGVVGPVDAGAVLGTAVVALPVHRRGVDSAEERLQEQAQLDHLGVIRHAHAFRGPGLAGADVFIGRVGYCAVGIADLRLHDAGQLLQVRLGAPEASAGQIYLLRVHRASSVLRRIRRICARARCAGCATDALPGCSLADGPGAGSHALRPQTAPADSPSHLSACRSFPPIRR